jgi:hypothetical protein
MRTRHYGKPPEDRNDWQTIKSLIPYLWEFRGRVLLAMCFDDLTVARFAVCSKVPRSGSSEDLRLQVCPRAGHIKKPPSA